MSETKKSLPARVLGMCQWYHLGGGKGSPTIDVCKLKDVC